MFRLLTKFRKDTSGAALVEYALLVALIAVVALGAVTTLGTSINTKMTTAADALK
jgi:pilus assembly protein Flp/PilA